MAENRHSLLSDDLPLWSAPFGMILLRMIPYRSGMNILDIGCGTGFPLIETASRCGSNCRLWGIDPDEEALSLCRDKIAEKQLNNVITLCSSAESLPFDSGFFDLITSNNGINNVQNPFAVMQECYRTLKPGGVMVYTANLPDTLAGFYSVFTKTLYMVCGKDCSETVNKHISDLRQPTAWHRRLIGSAGLVVGSEETSGFYMQFADGNAFLLHPLIRTAFLPRWNLLIPDGFHEAVWNQVRLNLNELFTEDSGIVLHIPFVCYRIFKPISNTDG